MKVDVRTKTSRTVLSAEASQNLRVAGGAVSWFKLNHSVLPRGSSNGGRSIPRCGRCLRPARERRHGSAGRAPSPDPPGAALGSWGSWKVGEHPANSLVAGAHRGSSAGRPGSAGPGCGVCRGHTVLGGPGHAVGTVWAGFLTQWTEQAGLTRKGVV